MLRTAVLKNALFLSLMTFSSITVFADAFEDGCNSIKGAGSGMCGGQTAGRQNGGLLNLSLTSNPQAMRNQCSGATCDLRFCVQFGGACVPKGLMAGKGSLILASATADDSKEAEVQCLAKINAETSLRAEKTSEGSGRLVSFLGNVAASTIEYKLNEMSVKLSLNYSQVISESEKACASSDSAESKSECEVKFRFDRLNSIDQNSVESLVYLATETGLMNEAISKEKISTVTQAKVSLYQPLKPATGGVSAISANTQGVYDLLNSEGQSVGKIFFSLPLTFRCE